jgi:hypothetical protein
VKRLDLQAGDTELQRNRKLMSNVGHNAVLLGFPSVSTSTKDSKGGMKVLKVTMDTSDMSSPSNMKSVAKNVNTWNIGNNAIIVSAQNDQNDQNAPNALSALNALSDPSDPSALKCSLTVAYRTKVTTALKDTNGVNGMSVVNAVNAASVGSSTKSPWSLRLRTYRLLAEAESHHHSLRLYLRLHLQLHLLQSAKAKRWDSTCRQRR